MYQVTNLLLYPDFEQNFDMFEPLRSMQVGGGKLIAFQSVIG